MTDNSSAHKLHIEKLIANSSNWMTYCNHIIWSLRLCVLKEHLTSSIVTQIYIDMGNINNRLPAQHWHANKATMMHVIATSIPNTVFTNIKSKTIAMEVWDALKVLYKACMTMLLVKTS